MYVDKAYYLAPDGAVAAEAFAVMREGMRGKAGIGKVALYGREYLVAVKPQEHGIVMYTLHHAAEMRSIDQIEELDSVPKTVKPEELKLAQQVVEMYSGELNLDDYKDEYKEELRRIIDAKVAGEEVVATAAPEAAEQRRRPDGGAAQEPRRGQRGEEANRQSGPAARRRRPPKPSRRRKRA